MSVKIEKIRIKSETICFGPEPGFNDETRQDLILHSDGKTIFESYRYGDSSVVERKVIKVSPELIQQIFKTIDQVVNDPLYLPALVHDVGTWRMRICYNHKEEKYKGSLVTGLGLDKVSNELRKLTDNPKLIAFVPALECEDAD